MSKYGCGKDIEITVPRGYSYRTYTTQCGSTSYNGGVNQCDECAEKYEAPPLPYEDEGDLEYDHRINHGDE